MDNLYNMGNYGGVNSFKLPSYNFNNNQLGNDNSVLTDNNPLDFSSWNLNPKQTTSLDFSNPNSMGFWGNLRGQTSDYFSNTPWIPQFDKVTGKTSGSILGDFGSLAKFGLEGLNTLNLYGAAKDAKKNMAAQQEAMKNQTNLAKLSVNEALANRERQRELNKGGITADQATEIGNRKARERMAQYGL